MPDEFRTMTACDSLGTMASIMGRYRSLVDMILEEVLRAVYEVRHAAARSWIFSLQTSATCHDAARE